MRATRPLAALALTIAALVSPAAAAAPSPVPPCGAETVPAYPDVGEPPAVQVWFGDDDGADWTPPGCTQWQEGGFTAMIGMAARFRHEGGLEALLARVGGISDSKRIRYWSVTRKRWRDLVEEAYALSSADPDARRPDFSADELVPGNVFHFLREPNSLIGAAVFRMVIVERAAIARC